MSEDGMSWTFHIRQGVNFHNGDPVRAKDVKFSLERFMHPDAKSPFTGTLKQNIDSIEVLDDYTVKVNTTDPLPFFPNTLSMYLGPEGCVMPMSYIINGAGEDFAAQSAFIDEAPVGSGPFKFVDRAKGDFMSFEVVEGHWRTTPAFKELIIYNVPEEGTRVAMLKAGEIDFCEVAPERIPELEAAGLGMLKTPNNVSPSVSFFGTFIEEAQDTPTADLKVRKALSLAINRSEIIEFLLLGEGTFPLPIGVVEGSPEVDIPYWEEYAKEAYRYDLEEAKALLAEAGYADGFDITLHTYPFTGRPWMVKLAEAVGAYWSAIGVNAQIITTDYGPLRAKFKKTPPDESLWGTATTNQATIARQSIPTLGMQSAYHSAGTFRLFNDPAIDSAIDDPFTMLDAESRKQAYQETIEMLSDTYVSVPIFRGNSIYGVSEEVGSWDPLQGIPHGLGEAWETVQHAK
jgi:peptide/nickel transport system substrate-binding protein